MTIQASNFVRRAALLLEVVVALAILTTAMGFLGAQLVTGLEMTTFSETQFRAACLADELVARAQLDPNMLERLAQVTESSYLEDKFDDRYPGYFWRIYLKPVEPERTDLYVVNAEILHQPDTSKSDSIDGAEVVQRLAYLKATPAKIDLVKDAGLNEAMAEQLSALVPIPGFDPRAVDLHQLVALDPQAMTELVPLMMSLLGGSGAQLPGGQDLAGQLLGQLGGLTGDGQGGADGKGGLPGGGDIPPDVQAQLDMLRRMAEEYEAGGGGGATPPAAGRPGAGRPGSQAGSGSGAGAGGRNPGGANTPKTPKPPTPPNAGGQPPGGDSQTIEDFRKQGGSGPNGEYTIEDLMRLRDLYEKQGG